jgi:Pentapeptide repeats (8 copies)
MAASDGTSGTGSPSSLAAGRDLIRSAAKWFIAGLGAIGAVLVAGSQVSSLGALDPETGRLWIAVAGVAVGLGAVLFAMWAVVDILASRQWTWDAVVRASTSSSSDGRPVRDWLAANPSALGGYTSVDDINVTYENADEEDPDLPALVALMTAVTDKVATVDLDRRWLRVRWRIAAGVTFGAIGILVFAWAANPPKAPDQPPASLRSNNLSGADLSGASLRNADLTGVDFRGTDLRNADLRGAVLKDVIWGDTTCPDGTNSDRHGNSRVATCKGHLLP